MRVLTFIKQKTGVVAVEFAMIIPVMISLFLGTAEVSQYIWANGDVSRISNAMNEVVHSADQMSNSTLETLMVGVSKMMDANARNTSMDVAVTSVLGCDCNDDENSTDVEPCYFTLWSRLASLDTDGTVTFQDPPHITRALFESDNAVLPTDTLEPETNYIVSEVDYTYRPALDAILQIGSVDLAHWHIGVLRYTDRMEMAGADTNEDVCDDLTEQNNSTS